MGAFNRLLVPGWDEYADRMGMALVGRGKWVNVRCDFHDDGAPSLRANRETGGWVCMACGVRGGDTLAHYMQLHGCDFVQAARELGAWTNDAQYSDAVHRPATLAPRDALQVAAQQLRVAVIVIGAARRGLAPNDRDWQQFLEAAGRVDWLAAEYAA